MVAGFWRTHIPARSTLHWRTATASPVDGTRSGHCVSFGGMSGLLLRILTRLTERVSKRLGKRTFLYGPGGFLHIVFKPNEIDPDTTFVRDAALVIDLEQDIAAAGISILWLPNRANVDGVAIVGRGVRQRRENAMVRRMCMAKAHYVGVRVLHDPQEALFFPIFEQIFVYAAGTAMDEQEIKLVLVELEFDPHMGGERT